MKYHWLGGKIKSAEMDVRDIFENIKSNLIK